MLLLLLSLFVGLVCLKFQDNKSAKQAPLINLSKVLFSDPNIDVKNVTTKAEILTQNRDGDLLRRKNRLKSPGFLRRHLWPGSHFGRRHEKSPKEKRPKLKNRA